MIFLNPRISLLWQYISLFKVGRVPLIRQLREELFSVQTEQEPGEVVRSQCQSTATTTSNSCGDQWIHRFEAYLRSPRLTKAWKLMRPNLQAITCHIGCVGQRSTGQSRHPSSSHLAKGNRSPSSPPPLLPTPNLDGATGGQGLAVPATHPSRLPGMIKNGQRLHGSEKE